MTDIELAWAAGFWDGEGNFNAYRKGNVYIIQANVNQIHLDTLERFRDAVELGRLYGPYPMSGGRSDQYRWKATGIEDVSSLANKLRPYMCHHKVEQFELAASQWASMRPTLLTEEERLERRRTSSREWARRKAAERRV